MKSNRVVHRLTLRFSTAARYDTLRSYHTPTHPSTQSKPTNHLTIHPRVLLLVAHIALLDGGSVRRAALRRLGRLLRAPLWGVFWAFFGVVLLVGSMGVQM